MLIRKPQLFGDDVPSSEITPRETFLNRRAFVTKAARLAAGTAAASLIPAAAWADNQIPTIPSKFSTSETQTPYVKATTFNNFYEFGTDKDEPAKNAHTLHTRPWTVQISGLVKKQQTLNVDDLAHYRPLENRVYRHRCVEAWSMVIPWDGYSLSELINFCQPLPSAKYLQFVSNINRAQMPDLPGGFDWPYTEGLRMDEAMHPLTMITFGCYGEVLPNQNGAPVRITVPWKWGYKSPKSIVKIIFTDKQPGTLWNEIEPSEYGFYSNVNPNTGHRLPQERERRIDSSAFPHYQPTVLFNGYGDQVASLYTGMDLLKNY